MAVVPSSATDIRLISGVPFTNDYKNTRWFNNVSEQVTYFNAKTPVHRINEANFQRMTGETFIACDLGIEALKSVNYVMFKNTQFSTKWWYGFVTRLEYVQRKRTNVYFQLDVIQTWMFDFKFKPSFVVREHCLQYKNDGSPVVNTIDEGLNYGLDYDIVSVKNFKPTANIYYLVIVTKSSLHNKGTTTENTITASVNGIPQPLCYYIHPFKLNGSTPEVNVGSSVADLTNIKDFLSNIFSQKSAVNNIVSMYVTEHFGYNPAFNGTGTLVYLSANNFEVARIADGETMNINTIYVKDLPEYQPNVIDCGDKYADFKKVNESKLLMHPYCVTILDDFKGNRLEIKNEYLNTKNLRVMIMGSLGVSNKVAYTLPDYLTFNLKDDTDKYIVSIDNSIINNNPQDVPIITDMLSAYLQGNRNSLENQKNSIIWNGIMSAIGGGVSGTGMGVGSNALGMASVGTSVVSGMGNTVLQLQAIQAKQKDISNVPPQMVKMGGNTAFDYGNDYSGFYIIKKQIKNEYIELLEDFFKMFGYKVNKVKLPNLKTRKYWNYVQTMSCMITGDFNTEDLNEIRQIFDNGITLWHVDNVGNYDLKNEVI